MRERKPTSHGYDPFQTTSPNPYSILPEVQADKWGQALIPGLQGDQGKAPFH